MELKNFDKTYVLNRVFSEIKSTKTIMFLISLLSSLVRAFSWFAVYKNLNIEAIGQINTFLLFGTYSSIFIGLEMHRSVNRDYILSERINNLFFIERMLLALLLNIIICVIMFSFFKEVFFITSFLLVFLYYFSEYLSLEFTRIQIATNRFFTPGLINNFFNVFGVITIMTLQLSHPVYIIGLISLCSFLKTFSLFFSVKNLMLENINRFRFKFSNLKSNLLLLIVGSLPFIITAFLDMIPNFLDRYFIKTFWGLEQLGIYNLYLSITGFFTMFIESFFLNTTYATLIKKMNSGNGIFFYKKLLLSVLILGFLFFTSFLIIGPLIFNYMQKEQFYDYYYTAFFSFIATLASIKGISFYLFYANKNENIYKNIYALGLVYYLLIAFAFFYFIKPTFKVGILIILGFSFIFNLFLYKKNILLNSKK